MASFDVMRLTPSQVTKRTRSLEQIAENLERYVQGLERGTVHWDIIVHLAQHMMVVNPKHQHDYDFRQNAPVMGSIGRQLRGRQFVDKLLYPAWVVQIGAAAARQNYNSECLLHRNLDPAVIDEIAVAELAGDQAIKKYKDQLPLPICDQDEAFMVMYENRRRGAHHSIVKAMKKDHMLVNDPYEVWKYVFRVRVATFFNTPSFMVGMNIRENHIMDQHLVSERLRALQHMADKQGSWLKSHIAAARASLLKMETFDDVHVLSMFLGSNSKITPTTESVILVSVAMWMHTPNDTRGECSVHFEAYRELVHILDEDSKTNPQVYDMWKSPSVHRPYPLLLAYLNEDDQGPQGLMALCKTNAGVEKHGRKQLAEDTACRKQIIEVKARQVKAEMKESYHQMPTSAEGRVRDGETGANERILHEAQGTKIHHDQKSKDAENRLVQDAHKLAHRGVQLFVKPEKSAQSPIPEQQKTTPSKQKLEEKSKQILIEILDEINSDGQFGDDSRWFCRLMKAVANPDQLFDHEKFDYLDTPDMLKGMKTHRLARLTRCVQRRKEFGGILVKLVAGRITSQMELGDMAVYFRRARIAVSKRRQNIPYGRMGRGILMLGMMVNSLEPIASNAPSSPQTEATPAAPASVFAPRSFSAASMVASPFSSTGSTLASTSQSPSPFSFFGGARTSSIFSTTATAAPATPGAIAQATSLFSTAAKGPSPFLTSGAASTTDGLTLFPFNSSTTGSATVRPPAFSSSVPDSIVPTIAAPPTALAPTTTPASASGASSRGSSALFNQLSGGAPDTQGHETTSTSSPGHGSGIKSEPSDWP